MTTKQQDREKDIREFRRRKQLFESLVEHPGWKELLQIARVQRETQVSLLLQLIPIGRDGLANMAEDNYRKGIAFGIDMVIGTPTATIQTALELIRQEEENSNAERFNLKPEHIKRNEQPSLFDGDDELGPDTVVTDLSGGE